MKLYFSPGACSLAPHIVATEAGIPVELVRVNIPTKTVSAEGDFWAVNPRGYVPALEIADGQVLTECPVIVQYLADQKPQAALAPANGTMERYRLQEILNFITAEIHKSIGALFNPAIKDEWLASQLGLIDRRVGALDKMLAGKKYLMGDNFSVADAYAFTVLNWTRIKNVDISKHANVSAYMARIGDRPKVKEAMKAEGLGG